jgi:hypothetical protein
MSTIRLPRAWLATAISGVLHIALGAALVFAFATPDRLAARRRLPAASRTGAAPCSFAAISASGAKVAIGCTRS